MNWSGWQSFLAMGGYGFYVWGSFVVFAALMLAEWWQVRLSLARVRRELRAQGSAWREETPA